MPIESRVPIELLESRWFLSGTQSFTITTFELSGAAEGDVVYEAAIAGASWYVVAAPATGQGSPASLYGGDVTTDGRLGEPTRLLAGSAGTVPSGLIDFGGELAFTQGSRLWLSDGTAGGTRAFGPTFELAPSELAVVGDNGATPLLFFSASLSGSDRELWVTDGSTDGTRRVADIIPGSVGSSPMRLTPVGERLFFTADDGVHGRELWVTNGTTAGTQLVIDLEPGLGSYLLTNLTALDEKVVFSRGSFHPRFWESGGTAESTKWVINTASGFAGEIWPVAGGVVSMSTIVEGGPYLSVYDGVNYPEVLGTFKSPAINPIAATDGRDLYFYAYDEAGPHYNASPGIYQIDLDGVAFFTSAGRTTVRSVATANGAGEMSGGIYVSEYNTVTEEVDLKYVGQAGGAQRFVLSTDPDDTPVVLLARGERALVARTATGATGSGQELIFVDGISDVTPPTVLAGAFDFSQGHAVRVSFSEDVSESLTLEDLNIVNQASGAVFSATSLEYDAATDAATLQLAPPLPDGNYRATLPAGSVADTAGNPLAEDVTLDFFVLAGDANRDRSVAFADFLILRSNFGRADSPLFSEADFNYDDKVDFGDFLILRSQFGVSLPPPSSGSLFAAGDGGGEDDEVLPE